MNYQIQQEGVRVLVLPENNMNDLLEKIKNEIVDEINNTFSLDKVVFVSIFGSWGRDENLPKSDIDLLIVFKNGFDFSEIEDSFKEKFIEIQNKHGLQIDYEYPGEYVSIEKLHKSLNGYGFVLNDDKVLIPKIGREDWNNFNGHRQYLSSLATPSKFIYGDEDKYYEYKEKSLITLVKILLLNKENDLIKLDNLSSDLTNAGKEFLGFCDTDQTKKYLNIKLPNIYEILIRDGFISQKIFGKHKINRSKLIDSLSYLTDRSTFELRNKFIGDLFNNDDKNLLQNSLDIGVNFILDNQKVLKHYSEKDIRKRFEGGIPEKGISLKDAIDEFKENILDGSIHQSSPNYLAFPDSGNSTSALIASILESFINQNLIATTKSAPTGTFVEMQVIRWLRNLVGFSNSDSLPENALGLGGFMTSCGTLSNTTALLAARCKTFPESRKIGLQKEKVKSILIVASDTLNHYSHIAGFWWLGLGEDNIVFVKPNSEFRFDYEDLEDKIIQNNDGIKSRVVAVVVLAGDSRTTTIENFNHISKITRKHKVWLHVDACHGGVLIFSKKHRNKIKGIEKADSISIDPHKGLGIPYNSSVVLFRDVKNVKLISKSANITIQGGSSDLGQITPFLGSRPFDSLKLWFLIKHLGLSGIDNLIDYRLNLVKKWSNKIDGSNLFESLNDPDLNSSVFSLSMKKVLKLFPEKNISVMDMSRLNKEIHDRVYKEGKICIHNFDIFDVKEKIFPKDKKVRVLGVTLGNPYTSSNDFNNHISYIESTARDIIKRT